VEMLTFLTKKRANSRNEESAHEEVQMKKTNKKYRKRFKKKQVKKENGE
jgi:hypothetical protein